MSGRVKTSVLLNEAVNLIVEISEEWTWVCYELGSRYDGEEWCPKDCNHEVDDGCVLHLLRMRINKQKDEKKCNIQGED